ncbi:hypothetical protein DJ90_6356 [Paenibacillus macerans]|uniref:Uncharacterized protein n=1 Tax=Paenibacillus macerans TaxID=44252 RepID=A0A090YDY3_PAEMA|nr:hypothetical protein DJ90_6356 [Paenibacillus macerans]
MTNGLITNDLADLAIRALAFSALTVVTRAYSSEKQWFLFLTVVLALI